MLFTTESSFFFKDLSLQIRYLILFQIYKFLVSLFYNTFW